jgi:hypothetical protein
VLAPETDELEGYQLAERLRAEVRATFARQSEKMTVSCGVASFPVHGITAGELLHSADRARMSGEAGRDHAVVTGVGALPEDAEKARSSGPARSPRLSHGRGGGPTQGLPVTPEGGATPSGRARARPSRGRAGAVAALLRDVGEVGVAESILNKAAPLSDEEWRELQRHPEIGARIVGAASSAVGWIRPPRASRRQRLSARSA